MSDLVVENKVFKTVQKDEKQNKRLLVGRGRAPTEVELTENLVHEPSLDLAHSFVLTSNRRHRYPDQHISDKRMDVC